MIELNEFNNMNNMEGLAQLEDNSIDCMVTDPPYGYSFMGKNWDKVLPSMDTWKECLRVMKPGAFAFVMSAPRQDVLSRMMINLEDAGFNTGFTSIYWTYASGFPKASNIGKKTQKECLDGAYSGFQPKPAVEVIIVSMKPLSESTYIDQALNNGKGVTWFDDCRIPTEEDLNGGQYQERDGIVGTNQGIRYIQPSSDFVQPEGRFPANLLVSDDVLNNGIDVAGGRNKTQAMSIFGNDMKEIIQIKRECDTGFFSRFFDLDAWAQKTFPFIIMPKASSSEKNEGIDNIEGTGNFHPTVKPIKLMAYLITLGSRPGDIILDPYAGSGTTGLASKTLNRDFICFELSEEYNNIAVARFEHKENKKQKTFDQW